MALIVEDGTGLSNAESYLSVADADTYHASLGTTAWTGANSVKEAALRKATRHLDGTYRHRWPGVRVNSSQALDWPRAGAEWSDSGNGSSLVYGSVYAIPSDSVPQAVKDATAELAVRALSETLAPDQDRSNAVKKVKLGPIEKEFMDGAPGTKARPQITMILSRLLAPIGRWRQA